MNPEEHDTEIVALMTDHQSALQFYIESLMPGDSSVKDVAQEANRIIWQKRADFELGTNFKAWIFSIARFQVRKQRYKAALDSRLVFCDELEDTITEELAKAPLELSERRKALQECLSKLKPSHRELIHHRYFTKSTLEGYAQQVGRSVGGLRVTLNRLRSVLLQCVERNLGMERKGIEQ